LQRPGFHSTGFHLYEGDSSFRKKNKAVGHSAATGTDKLGRDTSHCPDRLNEFLFDLFFSH